MANHVLLNNIDHKDLKILTAHGAQYGDAVMYAPTFPAEFRSLQAEYPIFFRKDDRSGQFDALAMFGFEAGENLFLSGNEWLASYVPLTIQRQPFLIGFQSAAGTHGESKTVVHVDMDNPRVNRLEGEAVFLAHGGISEYLEGVIATLHAIHEGLATKVAFMEALLEHDLLESFTLDVQLDDGSEHRLLGFHTINEEAIGELSGEALAHLNGKGFLQPVYMVLASLSNIRKLIERKNALSSAK